MEAHSDGWRRGMFDKCNGLPQKSFDDAEFTDYMIDYVIGYHEGWDTHTRRV